VQQGPGRPTREIHRLGWCGLIIVTTAQLRCDPRRWRRQSSHCV